MRSRRVDRHAGRSKKRGSQFAGPVGIFGDESRIADGADESSRHTPQLQTTCNKVAAGLLRGTPSCDLEGGLGTIKKRRNAATVPRPAKVSSPSGIIGKKVNSSVPVPGSKSPTG